ncbi:MAG: hypothetical protein AVDCRST_MAG68-4332 [uncultured Gemmatimonadetes bacterium]|uniref:Uncharacterized protein n=1 Tax=uncultured Gemmatimonadota bacterium TaxID=203437 RepID=A0A6J4MIG1_9BACT|nr:MAG: hypothetical protein AVDCRST_MAG68-4332 [uncultured Gemmatimonadota bacterium]
MWYERQFGFRSEPYPRFQADVVWSLVVVAVVAVFVLQIGAPLVAAAAAAGGVGAWLAWVLYRRVVAERTRLIRTTRPPLGRLMARYGAAPRPSRTAGQAA